MRWRFRLWRWLLAATVSFGIYYQLRMAAADYIFQSDTVKTVHRSLGLAPENVSYLERLAELDEKHAVETRERELTLQPRLPRVLMNLAADAEWHADLDRSEHLLLRAAEVDRTWLPRWILTNFYFRRSAHTEFWTWARQSASFGYGDLNPLFDMCMQVTNDAGQIQRELSIESPFALRAYVNYLRSHGHLKDAGVVSRRLVRTGAARDDLMLLLSMVDQLIDTGDASGASALWNDLAARRWIPVNSLDPLRPVTNPELVFPFMGRAFDWRMKAQDGVTVIPGTNGRGLIVTFSGAQADHCVVLEQIVPVEPGVVYRITHETDSRGVVPGLSWVIERPGDAAMLRLQLVYARRAGYTRFDGSIQLTRVDLVVRPL